MELCQCCRKVHKKIPLLSLWETAEDEWLPDEAFNEIGSKSSLTWFDEMTESATLNLANKTSADIASRSSQDVSAGFWSPCPRGGTAFVPSDVEESPNLESTCTSNALLSSLNSPDLLLLNSPMTRSRTSLEHLATNQTDIMWTSAMATPAVDDDASILLDDSDWREKPTPSDQALQSPVIYMAEAVNRKVFQRKLFSPGQLLSKDDSLSQALEAEDAGDGDVTIRDEEEEDDLSCIIAEGGLDFFREKSVTVVGNDLSYLEQGESLKNTMECVNTGSGNPISVIETSNEINGRSDDNNRDGRNIQRAIFCADEKLKNETAVVDRQKMVYKESVLKSGDGRNQKNLSGGSGEGMATQCRTSPYIGKSVTLVTSKTMTSKVDSVTGHNENKRSGRVDEPTEGSGDPKVVPRKDHIVNVLNALFSSSESSQEEDARQEPRDMNCDTLLGVDQDKKVSSFVNGGGTSKAVESAKETMAGGNANIISGVDLKDISSYNAVEEKPEEQVVEDDTLGDAECLAAMMAEADNGSGGWRDDELSSKREVEGNEGGNKNGKGVVAGLEEDEVDDFSRLVTVKKAVSNQPVGVLPESAIVTTRAAELNAGRATNKIISASLSAHRSSRSASNGLVSAPAPARGVVLSILKTPNTPKSLCKKKVRFSPVALDPEKDLHLHNFDVQAEGKRCRLLKQPEVGLATALLSQEDSLVRQNPTSVNSNMINVEDSSEFFCLSNSDEYFHEVESGADEEKLDELLSSQVEDYSYADESFERVAFSDAEATLHLVSNSARLGNSKIASLAFQSKDHDRYLSPRQTRASALVVDHEDSIYSSDCEDVSFPVKSSPSSPAPLSPQVHRREHPPLNKTYDSSDKPNVEADCVDDDEDESIYLAAMIAENSDSAKDATFKPVHWSKTKSDAFENDDPDSDLEMMEAFTEESVETRPTRKGKGLAAQEEQEPISTTGMWNDSEKPSSDNEGVRSPSSLEPEARNLKMSMLSDISHETASASIDTSPTTLVSSGLPEQAVKTESKLMLTKNSSRDASTNLSAHPHHADTVKAKPNNALISKPRKFSYPTKDQISKVSGTTTTDSKTDQISKVSGTFTTDSKTDQISKVSGTTTMDSKTDQISKVSGTTTTDSKTDQISKVSGTTTTDSKTDQISKVSGTTTTDSKTDQISKVSGTTSTDSKTEQISNVSGTTTTDSKTDQISKVYGTTTTDSKTVLIITTVRTESPVLKKTCGCVSKNAEIHATSAAREKLDVNVDDDIVVNPNALPVSKSTVPNSAFSNNTSREEEPRGLTKWLSSTNSTWDESEMKESNDTLVPCHMPEGSCTGHRGNAQSFLHDATKANEEKKKLMIVDGNQTVDDESLDVSLPHNPTCPASEEKHFGFAKFSDLFPDAEDNDDERSNVERESCNEVNENEAQVYSSVDWTMKENVTSLTSLGECTVNDHKNNLGESDATVPHTVIKNKTLDGDFDNLPSQIWELTEFSQMMPPVPDSQSDMDVDVSNDGGDNLSAPVNLQTALECGDTDKISREEIVLLKSHWSAGTPGGCDAIHKRSSSVESESMVEKIEWSVSESLENDFEKELDTLLSKTKSASCERRVSFNVPCLWEPTQTASTSRFAKRTKLSMRPASTKLKTFDSAFFDGAKYGQVANLEELMQSDVQNGLEMKDAKRGQTGDSDKQVISDLQGPKKRKAFSLTHSDSATLLASNRFEGFSTASGKTISVSEKAKEKASDILASVEDDSTGIVMASSNISLDTNVPIIAGNFGGETQVSVSCEQEKHQRNTAVPTNLESFVCDFSSAGGKTIALSHSSREKAAQLWEMTGAETGFNEVIDIKNKETFSLGRQQDVSSMIKQGFTGASENLVVVAMKTGCTKSTEKTREKTCERHPGFKPFKPPKLLRKDLVVDVAAAAEKYAGDETVVECDMKERKSVERSESHLKGEGENREILQRNEVNDRTISDTVHSSHSVNCKKGDEGIAPKANEDITDDYINIENESTNSNNVSGVGKNISKRSSELIMNGPNLNGNVNKDCQTSKRSSELIMNGPNLNGNVNKDCQTSKRSSELIMNGPNLNGNVNKDCQTSKRSSELIMNGPNLNGNVNKDCQTGADASKCDAAVTTPENALANKCTSLEDFSSRSINENLDAVNCGGFNDIRKNSKNTCGTTGRHTITNVQKLSLDSQLKASATKIALKPAKTRCGEDVCKNDITTVVRNPSNFPGFSTALGSKVKISENALKHAKRLFEEDTNNDNTSNIVQCTTGVPAFSTVLCSNIEPSGNYLKRAKMLFDEDTMKNDTDTKDDAELIMISSIIPSVSKVSVSESALSNAKATSADDTNSDHSAANFPGFCTASGSKVIVSSNASKRAKNVFNEGAASASSETNVTHVTVEHITNCSEFSIASGSIVRTLGENSPKHPKPFFYEDTSLSVTASCSHAQRVANFRGFSTALGSEVKISDSALKHAKAFFDEDTSESNITTNNAHFPGFSTTSVSKANASNSALKHSKTCFDEDANVSDSTNNAPQCTANFPDLSTALGSKVKTSDSALKHAKAFFDEDISESNTTANNTHCNAKFPGFSTALGSEVKISDSALKHAKTFLDEDTSGSDAPNIDNAHQGIADFPSFPTSLKSKVDVSDNASKDSKTFSGENTSSNNNNITKIGKYTGFSGFSTASGSKVKISENALNHAKTLFIEDSCSTDTTNTAQNTANRFSITSGSRFDLSENAMKDSKTFLNKNDSRQCDIIKKHSIGQTQSNSIRSGFPTAAISDTDVCENALNLNHAEALPLPVVEEDCPIQTDTINITTTTSVNVETRISDFPAFSTASGSDVIMSRRALTYAKSFFNENLADKREELNSNKNAGRVIDQSSSSSNSRISIGSNRNSKFIMSAERSNSDNDKQTTVVNDANRQGLKAGKGTVIPITHENSLHRPGRKSPQRKFRVPLRSSCEEHLNDRKWTVRNGKRLTAVRSTVPSGKSKVAVLLDNASHILLPTKRFYNGLDCSSSSSSSTNTVIDSNTNYSHVKVKDNISARKTQSSFVPPASTLLPQSGDHTQHTETKKLCSSSSSSISADAVSSKFPLFLPRGSSSKTVIHQNSLTMCRGRELELEKEDNSFMMRPQNRTSVSAVKPASPTPQEIPVGDAVALAQKNESELCDKNSVNEAMPSSGGDTTCHNNGADYYAPSIISADHSSKDLPASSNLNSSCGESGLNNEEENRFLCENVTDHCNTSKSAEFQAAAAISSHSHPGPDGLDEPTVNLELEEARMKQEKIIRSKKRKKVTPLPGRWWNNRGAHSNRRVVKLHDAVGDRQPLCRNELARRGVSESTLKVSSRSAGDLRFDLQRFFPSLTGGVLLGDGALLIPDGRGFAGASEFHRYVSIVRTISPCWCANDGCNHSAFLTLEGVDTALVDESWLRNHYRWIVWKLAAYEVCYPSIFANRCLTPEVTMLQLKYRYDREIDNCQRSAIKKIVERDDTACKRMVLCIADIGRSVGNRHDSVLEVTDGWYSIAAHLDPPLQDLVERKKLSIGQKIMTSGVELNGIQDGCPPLEIPESAHFKLSFNATRPARADSKLGFCSVPLALCVPLACLHPEGGTVGCVDVIVVRKYPLMYMEKCSDKGCIFRTAEEEDVAQRKEEEHRQNHMEKMYASIEREMDGQNEHQSKQSRLRRRRRRKWTRKQVEQLSAGLELAEAFDDAINQEEFEQFLNETQISKLMDHKRRQMECRQEEINKKLKESVSAFVPRNVTTLQKFRLAGCSSYDIDRNCGCVLTVWRPDGEWQDMQEGKRYRMFNLAVSAGRQNTKNSCKIALTANRQTRLQPKTIHENLVDLVYEPRQIYHVAEIKDKCKHGNGGQAVEFDFLGVAVRVHAAEQPGHPHVIHAADPRGDILSIKFWSIVPHSAPTVKESNCFIVTGLSVRSHHDTGNPTIPLTADGRPEFTAFSTSCHLSSYAKVFREFDQLCKDSTFLSKARSRLQDCLENCSRLRVPFQKTLSETYQEDFPPEIMEKIFCPMSSQEVDDGSSTPGKSGWQAASSAKGNGNPRHPQTASSSTLNSTSKSKKRRPQANSVQTTADQLDSSSTLKRKSSMTTTTLEESIIKRKKKDLHNRMGRLLTYGRPSPLAQLPSNAASPACGKNFKSPKHS